MVAGTWSKETHAPIGFGSVERATTPISSGCREGSIEGYALINPRKARALQDGVRITEGLGASRAARARGLAALASWAANHAAASDLPAMDRVTSSSWMDALEGLDALLSSTGLPSPERRPSHELFGEATSVKDYGGTTIRGIGVRFETQPFVMGEGTGFLGVWDRSHPQAPVARFPTTEDGRLARDAFFITRCFDIQSSEYGEAWKVPDRGSSPTGPGASETTMLEQERFLLGWGIDFIGIWDRVHPQSPVQSFPESQEGSSRAGLNGCGFVKEGKDRECR
jgi:hypothetical protein